MQTNWSTYGDGDFAEDAFWNWFVQMLQQFLQTRRHQLHTDPHLILTHMTTPTSHHPQQQQQHGGVAC